MLLLNTQGRSTITNVVSMTLIFCSIKVVQHDMTDETESEDLKLTVREGLEMMNQTVFDITACTSLSQYQYHVCWLLATHGL